MPSEDTTVRVCLDAMGGDYAPHRIVEGALEATRSHGDRISVYLVGDRGAIERALSDLGAAPGACHVVHASESVGMGEKAARAVRQKRNSSLAVAAKMMQNGEADALVSAGNTGAVVSTALIGLGRVQGVLRPAIASVIPNSSGRCVVLDVGANADCKPEYLAQFAVMGSIYAETTLGIPSPRVGLLNIGEEPGKGNELSRAASLAIAGSPVHFVGNLEGRDIMSGAADVVVCDGFVGNVVLKFAESLVETLAHMVKTELKNDYLGKIGVGLARPAIRRVFKKLDYAEYGGAPLLGVRGGCIICHGSSSVRAIKNAIRVAAEFVEFDLIGKIAQRLEKGQAHG